MDRTAANAGSSGRMVTTRKIAARVNGVAIG